MLDLDVIDAHHHLCHLSAASYPWLEGPRVTRYHGDDVPLRRDYLLDDYRADAAQLDALGAQLAGSVHVENGAADPLWESRWIDTLITGNDIPSVQVVKVDLSAPDALTMLTLHAALPSVRGVRDILNWHPDPVYTHRDRADLLTDPAWLAGLAALRRFAFSFDLQVFPGQLRQAADLAADNADIAIVLDHAGMPIDRDPAALDRWRRDLTAVAARPNTTVKISALGTSDHTWTTDSIRRVVLDTIDAFGPSRCMFASNFPVDGLYSTFGRLFAAFDAITAGFDGTERTDLFAGTARRFYRI
ncbi:amidohydrolase family protein [Actinoplanes sp. NPDC051475]|uniref:amidohydrolase family protein n=1 Tax=Actinoplanes sp. NPDC051475 TaxID=3157225 RepID=UPI00344FF8B7